jgi:hypothetical protein
MFQFLHMAALIAAMARPTPTAACTVVQVDETHFNATVTWSGFAVSSLDFLQGPTSLDQSELKHASRRGDVTVTLSTTPTAVQLTGPKLGLHQACVLVA